MEMRIMTDDDCENWVQQVVLMLQFVWLLLLFVGFVWVPNVMAATIWKRSDKTSLVVETTVNGVWFWTPSSQW